MLNTILCLELNLRKRKWLVIGICKPPSYSEDAFIKSLLSCFTNTTKEFANIALLGDFNMTAENTKMEQLMNTFSLERLITTPTCFRSVTPTCVDLILTNYKQYFMKSQALVTGISDLHALTLTIMRNTFYKGNPKTKLYRDFKNFDYEMFENKLSYSLQAFQLLDYTRFYNVFLPLLNKYAPIKKKILRENRSSFMAKTLRKAIMLRSQLKNKFIKSQNNEDWSNYKKQRNFCTKFLKKTKQNYFGELDMKHLNDSRNFWKRIKPFFSDKGVKSNKMMIIEKDKLFSEERSIADVMKNYFVGISKSLNLKGSSESNVDNIGSNIRHSLKNVLFEDDISVKIIREKNADNAELRFQPISTKELKKIIIGLDCNKSNLNGCIPANVLKDTCDTFIPYLTEIINDSFQNGNFTIEL